MTYVLALDTTSKYASLAISMDGAPYLEYNFNAQNHLSASLLPTLQAVLENGGLTVQDIDVFGIAVGPGLFTGLRVGLSTLKGLLFDRQTPVVPVVTLDALVLKVPDNAANVVSLIDARRDEVYVGVYRGGDEPEPTRAPALLHFRDLEGELKNLDPISFVGSGAEFHRSWIESHFPGSRIVARSPFLAAEIGKIAYRQYLRQEYVTDLQKLMPLYIRKPDAEKNLEAQNRHPHR